MKRGNKLIVAISFIIFGILIGIQFDSVIVGDFTSPYTNEIEAQELADLKKSTEEIKARIISLKEQVDILEQERAGDSIPLQKLKATVDEYKFLAGYSPVAGPGITITLESEVEDNIAEVIEAKRYLINLINELKVFSGEVISINGYRIVGRTEVTLAGNHINVNGRPIAPPYVIHAIGNLESFERYVKHGTMLFELMASDGISSNIKFSDNVQIPALTKDKPIQFLKAVEE